MNLFGCCRLKKIPKGRNLSRPGSPSLFTSTKCTFKQSPLQTQHEIRRGDGNTGNFPVKLVSLGVVSVLLGTPSLVLLTLFHLFLLHRGISRDSRHKRSETVSILASSRMEIEESDGTKEEGTRTMEPSRVEEGNRRAWTDSKHSVSSRGLNEPSTGRRGSLNLDVNPPLPNSEPDESTPFELEEETSSTVPFVSNRVTLPGDRSTAQGRRGSSVSFTTLQTTSWFERTPLSRTPSFKSMPLLSVNGTRPTTRNPLPRE